MSDFRFKISGDSSPFLVELYNANTCSLVESQVFEYSGITSSIPNHTCVIFDGLSAGMNYYAAITDCVGNTQETCTITTPSDPVIQPTQIDVSLLGTYYHPSQQQISNIICSVSEPKYIDITPAPQAGQSVTVDLSAIASATTDSTSYIKLYKRLTPTGNYNEIYTIQQENINVDPITISEGERVCYDIYTAIDGTHVGENIVCAELRIDNISTSGYDNPVPSIVNGCLDISETKETTTTTSTTTAPPVIVYMGDITPSTSTYRSEKTAALCTEPALNSFQSFKVYFELVNYRCNDVQLDTNMFTCGCITEGSATVDELSYYGSLPVNNSISSTDGYVNVNASNINDINFYSKVESDIANAGIGHEGRQTIRITNITNQNGGNFIFTGTTSYPDRIVTNVDIEQATLSTGGGGSSLPEEDGGDETIDSGFEQETDESDATL